MMIGLGVFFAAFLNENRKPELLSQIIGNQFNCN